MDLDYASGSPFNLKIGNQEIQFKPITIRQFEKLRQDIPGLSTIEKLKLSPSNILEIYRGSPELAIRFCSMSSGLSTAELQELKAPLASYCSAVADVFVRSFMDQSGEDDTGDPK